MISKIKYKRVLLKLSGESLLGNKLHSIDEKIVTFLVEEIKKVYKRNIQISVVIGGGNIFRGTDCCFSWDRENYSWLYGYARYCYKRSCYSKCT